MIRICQSESVFVGAAWRPRLGQTRVKVLDRLATGGMASIYLARVDHPGRGGRFAALKQLHPHLAERPRVLALFEREAQLVARLDHPNVCSAAAGAWRGPVWFAMDYVLGENLACLLDRIVDGPELATQVEAWPQIAAHVVAEACEGMHAIHELRDDAGAPLDIVHCDLSPSNLLVTYGGGTVVIDFGVALCGPRNAADAGGIKGKLAYIAPEQAMPERDIDRRSDVWSLGVCLWEALTLKRLFRRDSDAATLGASLRAPVLPPSRLRPGIPAELDGICLRALERLPHRRFRTAGDFAVVLRDFIRRTRPVNREHVADAMRSVFRERLSQRLSALRLAGTG